MRHEDLRVIGCCRCDAGSSVQSPRTHHLHTRPPHSLTRALTLREFYYSRPGVMWSVSEGRGGVMVGGVEAVGGGDMHGGAVRPGKGVT